MGPSTLACLHRQVTYICDVISRGGISQLLRPTCGSTRFDEHRIHSKQMDHGQQPNKRVSNNMKKHSTTREGHMHGSSTRGDGPGGSMENNMAPLAQHCCG